MNQGIQHVTQADGYITVLRVNPSTDAAPKGSVVIYHGMAEHHERYDEYTKVLNSIGYDVYRYDHRGHGLDKKEEELGYIADREGHRILISDAVTVIRYVKEHNRGQKLILMSHSMGSLIGRNVTFEFSDIDAAIFMGTANPTSLTSHAGLMTSSLIRFMKGPKHRSALLDKAMFQSSLYKKLCTKTTSDWLTRDSKHVKKYIDDPYCGFICTSSFYHDLVTLSYLAGKKERIEKTRHDLPILFISGEKDPVGGYSKDVKRLAALYQSLNFTKVEQKYYKDCRHELLNELNAEEIMQFLADWIQKTVE